MFEEKYISHKKTNIFLTREINIFLTREKILDLDYYISRAPDSDDKATIWEGRTKLFFFFDENMMIMMIMENWSILFWSNDSRSIRCCS